MRQAFIVLKDASGFDYSITLRELLRQRMLNFLSNGQYVWVCCGYPVVFSRSLSNTSAPLSIYNKSNEKMKATVMRMNSISFAKNKTADAKSKNNDFCSVLFTFMMYLPVFNLT